jgi:hypothetical protein
MAIILKLFYHLVELYKKSKEKMMKRNKVKNKLFHAFILSALFLFPAFLSAQSSSMEPGGTSSSKAVIYPVKMLTQELKKDVNLTGAQTPEVMKVLRQFEAETYEAKGDKEDVKDATNDAKEDISDILTDSQKNEWKSSMDKWWNSVNKELNLSNLNMSMNGNKM